MKDRITLNCRKWTCGEKAWGQRNYLESYCYKCKKYGSNNGNVEQWVVLKGN